MQKRWRTVLKVALISTATVASGLAAFVTVGVRASEHPVVPAALGTAVPFSQFAAWVNVPGPLEVETIVGAEWQVDRSGLINLKHPQAKAAGLKAGLEPIQIFTHTVRHPQHGTFLIDTGVEKALRDNPSQAAVQGIMAKAMHMELLHVKRDTAAVVTEAHGLAGVFFTHLHYDHIAGMPDVPKGTPLYAGPGETSQRFFLNALAKPTTDRALAGHEPIGEWQFTRDPEQHFEGILDVFGDNSLFALWVPGHTAGSTAYLARTAKGPVLFVGDTCHTAWGWVHGVEPGDFTRDAKRNAESLQRLRSLVSAHPQISVRLGHQHLEAGGLGVALASPGERFRRPRTDAHARRESPRGLQQATVADLVQQHGVE